MATDEQKLKTRLMLRVPLSMIESALDGLNASELTLLDEAITGFEKVKFRAADVEIKGVVVKAETARQLYRDEVWSLIEMTPNSDSIVIGRA